MICHQCGKELPKDARFCSYCGAPVPTETDRKAPPSDTDAPETAVSTENTAAPETAVSTENTAAPETAVSTENTDPAESMSPRPLPDLVLKKGNIAVSNEKLHINSKHYIRKAGGKRFKVNNAFSVICLENITGCSAERYRYAVPMFAAFLFFAIFTAILPAAVRFGAGTWQELQIPYEEERISKLFGILSRLRNDGPQELADYRQDQEDIRADISRTQEILSDLESRRNHEVFETLSFDGVLDIDRLLRNDFFDTAYRRYLDDLLAAFKTDRQLNSWLYSYYEAEKAYGANSFLDTDLWIYSGMTAGNRIFSPDLEDVSSLTQRCYDLDFYEHILFTGRIYVTGADFLKKILAIPRYAVDAAVFADAFDGSPYPENMTVPGWSDSDYEEFWLYAEDYYYYDKPMWLDYGLSAEDFSLDWNLLMDEDAYYAAYINFMDTIAPGLPRYTKAFYRGSNDALGGMGFELEGAEPSVHEILGLYMDTHPEFWDQLQTQNIATDKIESSVDKQLADTRALLEEYETELAALQEKEQELSFLFLNEAAYRREYDSLTTAAKEHRRSLLHRLSLCAGAALLSFILALFNLCRFFCLLKRPRHLFIVCQADAEYAFSLAHFSKEDILALQKRLPTRST